MKKIIAILVGLMVSFSVPAYGEEIDFSQMSLDELTALYTQFIQEFHTRTEEHYGASLIFEGVYTAGKDLKPGRYQFICIEKDEKVYAATFGIYSPSEPNPERFTCISAEYITMDSTLPIYFEILENQKFNLENCYGVLIPADLQNKPSWMP